MGYREESYASVIDRAKKAGHDGVILMNTRDGGPNDVIYVAFEENQISTMFNPARGEEQLFPVTRRASRELAADLDEASFTDATEDEIAAETQAAAPQAASIRVTDGEGVHFDLTPMATTTVGRMLQDADLKGLGTIPRAMAEFVMRRLTALVPDVRVHVVSDFDMALIKADALGGYYGDVRDFIVIPESVARDPAKRLRVMLHEAVHAATSREIRKSAGLLPQGRGFAADIRRIMDAVHAATGDAGLDAADGRYAFEDEAEFVAEAFSNARFQELLAKTPLDGATARALGLESGRYSLFTAFLAKIRAFFGDARISISALEAITRVGTTIMESDRQARQARTAARQALGLPSFITTAAVRRAGEIRGEGFLFNTRRKLVALMTVDGIRQQFRGLFVDGKGDALQDFVEALQRITPYANVKREAGEKVAQRFIDFADRNPEAAKLFSELAIRATMLDVNPEPGGSNAHLGKTAWWGWQAKAFLPSLQRQYAEMVAKAPEAAALWRDMTAYYRTTQNEITTALVENILDTAQVPVTGQQRADLIKKVMDGTLDEKVDRPVLGATLFNALKQAKEVRAIGGAYFPLMRQGNFVVRTKDAVGDLMGGVEVEPGIVEFRGKTEAEARRKAAAFAGRVYDDAPVVNLVRNVEQPKTATDFAVRVHVQLEGVHFFDSFAEAQEFIAEAKRSNYTEVSGVMDRADAFSMGDLTSTQLASIMSSIDARFPGDQNKAKREQLRAVMKEASYRLMAGNRIQQRSIARRNVRGASTDMARNTLQYAEAASRYLAKIRFAPAAREAMARMRAVQKGNYDGNEGARNQVLNELEKRFESNVVSPQEDNPLVHNLLALSFLDKLFSPAYSFVNAMQVGMNTLPVLAGRYGLPEAGAQIASAYRAVGVTSAVGGGVANTLRAARAFSQAAVLNSEDVLGSIKTKLAAEPDGARLVALLDMLQERGAIDPGAGFELAQAYSQGMGPTGRTVAKFDRIARQLPIAVEAVNRSVSAVASYRLALANGMTEAQARSFAFDTVMNTQGDYSAMNAPAVFNHPVGRLALQFKKYAQLMYALLGDMLHRSFKGATPAERRVARRELAYLMGVHVLMAGALGVPGMEVVKLGMMSAAALGIGGGYDDFEREVRAAMAEMFGPEVAEKLMKGVLPRTLGIDLSTRVGADSLLTFGEPRKYEKDGALAWVATTVAGAPAGLVFDAFQAARGFADAASGKATGEDLFKAFERLPLPKVVADTLAAGRKLAYGQTSGTTGKQVEEPVGVGTAALNALGLRTAGQAERAAQRGAMYAARGEEMERDREISKLKNRFAEARTEGERVKVLARLKEVNKRLPEDERVTPADLKAFARSYQRDKAKGLTKNGFRVGDEAEMRRLERAGSYYNVR